MRQVFRDFEQLDRQAFALKYKLNVPKERCKIEEDCEISFPFLDMPTDLQCEVIFKLDLVDLLLAPLVCKKWHEIASKHKNSVLPKLGNHILSRYSVKVSLQIRLFPTVFHFCLANNIHYSPLKHFFDAKYLSEFPFGDLRTSASEQEEILLRLKRLILAKKYRCYWWNSLKEEIFIELTENAGLGVISKYVQSNTLLN